MNENLVVESEKPRKEELVIESEEPKLKRFYNDNYRDIYSEDEMEERFKNEKEDVIVKPIIESNAEDEDEYFIDPVNRMDVYTKFADNTTEKIDIHDENGVKPDFFIVRDRIMNIMNMMR